MVLATLLAIVNADAAAVDDLVFAHVVAPDVNADRVNGSITAVLDRIRPDEVVAAANVVAECVGAHFAEFCDGRGKKYDLFADEIRCSVLNECSADNQVSQMANALLCSPYGASAEERILTTHISQLHFDHLTSRRDNVGSLCLTAERDRAAIGFPLSPYMSHSLTAEPSLLSATH
jgi:hypothetical protein